MRQRPRRRARRERQRHHDADDAGQERHLQPRRPLQQRLLRHDTPGVGERRRKAQRGAPPGVDAAIGRRSADDDRAGERDRAAGEQRAVQRLVQQQACEQRDEDRPDVDEHRGRPRIDPLLGGVEQHVVGAEPEHPAEDQARHVRARRQRLAADGDEDAEHTRGDQQPAERERPGGQLAPGVADPDERRRPEADGDERGPEREQVGAGASGWVGDGGGGRLGHGATVARRCFGARRTGRLSNDGSGECPATRYGCTNVAKPP